MGRARAHNHKDSQKKETWEGAALMDQVVKTSGGLVVLSGLQGSINLALQ